MADVSSRTDLGTLIVTGASRGIGAGVALAAADFGYSVAVNYVRDGTAATRIVDQIRAGGRAACAIGADMKRESDIMQLFERAEAELGPIRALVNNAGITGGFARVQDVDAAMLEQLMTVNVIGPILCAREAVKRMSTRNGKSEIAAGVIWLLSPAASYVTGTILEIGGGR